MIRSRDAWQSYLSERKPLVTIVIPCFNKAGYIGDSIRAATSQTYPYIEILVVNDGSTDSSLTEINSVIKETAPYKSQILTKSNSGISDTRNYAIARASGELIMPLDGDDLVDPAFVEKGMRMMRETGCNLVTADVELFGAESGTWEPPQYEAHALRYNNCIPTLVLYDRSLWSSVNGYSCSLPFNEDWDFFIRCSAQGLRARKIEEKLFRYRVTHDGLAHNFIKETWKWSVSLMVTGNPELYAVTEVLWAHEQLQSMPPRWVERFIVQRKLFPNEDRLSLWLAIAAEGRGEKENALAFLEEISVDARSRWQASLRSGLLLEHRNPSLALQHLHQARIIRPDLSSLVEQRISAVTNAAQAARRDTA